MSSTVPQSLKQHRIIPVIVIDDAAKAEPLANALVEGGLPLAEITFRTPAAEAAIRSMALRGDLLVGAGTVLSVEQVDQARDAGASFLVSPGFNPKVVRRSTEVGIPIFPGVAAPTEIEQALDHGLSVVKFFPAEAMGGVKTLRAIAAPYGSMHFIPTGGIGPENLKDYLSFDKVLACGGSWMVAPQLYAAGDFTPVVDAVRSAVSRTHAN